MSRKEYQLKQKLFDNEIANIGMLRVNSRNVNEIHKGGDEIDLIIEKQIKLAEEFGDLKEIKKYQDKLKKSKNCSIKMANNVRNTNNSLGVMKLLMNHY